MQRAVHYLSTNDARTWLLDGRGLVPGEPAAGAALVVVADLADESYVLAKLPRMRGSDAGLLRRRRLEREFPASPWRRCRPCGAVATATGSRPS